MKHGYFNAKNELVDTEGNCFDCGKNYTLFRPCDCDLKTLDEHRAAKLDSSKISIAVVTTDEGNQEAIKTTSLAEVMVESYYLRSFLEKYPDARPTLGYQRPEPDILFDQADEGVAINFFEIGK